MSEKQTQLTEQKQRLNWSLLLGVGFFLFVLIATINLAMNFTDWLVQDKDVQLKHLHVQGEPKFTAQSDIVAAVKQANISTFFDLDVKQMQTQVTALPWVASASVRKQWPDTLQVYVVEHKAVAHWNDSLMINQQGEVFSAPSQPELNTLPRLFGPEGSEQEAWHAFEQFAALFKVNNLRLNSLALSERFAWQLWLDNGIKLNLGREEKAKRVQRFIDIYPHLKKRQDVQVDSVDLRYDTGLAVRFKPLTNTEQQKSKA